MMHLLMLSKLEISLKAWVDTLPEDCKETN
jgi:hypothetical protein